GSKRGFDRLATSKPFIAVKVFDSIVVLREMLRDLGGVILGSIFRKDNLESIGREKRFQGSDRFRGSGFHRPLLVVDRENDANETGHQGTCRPERARIRNPSASVVTYSHGRDFSISVERRSATCSSFSFCR